MNNDILNERISKLIKELEELKEQIAYIEQTVISCRKACNPKSNDKERGEWLGYRTVESIIRNSRDKERRDYDAERGFFKRTKVSIFLKKDV